ncbi:nitrate- and nitrite sensing domain-containing protein [Novispirillum itersonii]|uniref:Hemerythrin-like metal-binding protein n=1 Tax=Novispirillum itersonii TaxID=189 RepID=A0A7W9ZJ35_NOVIT|nr:nitrate- and nitrite sensing domain-containing protein [Novispirillum itersonii]MBB6211089.1 hemerythrin-like metal-binding protein [Novispirillum itersonii]
MEQVQWSDNFDVGVPVLDEGHHTLLARLDALYAAVEADAPAADLLTLLDSINSAARSHYSEEEGEMRRFGYPRTEEHAAVHARSLEEISTLIRRLRDNDPTLTPLQVRHTLYFWFHKHFLDEDADFSRFLLGRGIAAPGRRGSALLQRLSQMTVSLRMAVLALVPLLGLILLGGLRIADALTANRDMEAVVTLASLAPDISAAVHELQKERGTSVGFTGAKGTAFGDAMKAQRTASDGKIATLRQSLSAFPAAAYGPDFLGKLDAARATLDQLVARRGDVDKLALPAPQVAAFYSGLIGQFLGTIEQMAAISGDAGISRRIFAYTAFLQAKERTGLERAIGSAGFGAGAFDQTLYSTFVGLIARQETFLQTFAQYATPAEKAFLAETVKGPDVEEVNRLRGIALASPFTGNTQGVAGPVWFDTITKKINLQKTVEDRLSQDLLADAAARAAANKRQLVLIATAVTVLTLAVVALTLLMIRSIIRPVRALTHASDRLAEGHLETEIPALLHRDEIGRMARAVQHFKDNAIRIRMLSEERASSRALSHEQQHAEMEKLARVFQSNVGSVIEAVSSASTEMQASAETLNTTAEQTSHRATEVSDSARHATVNVETVAAAAEELSASITEIGRQVEESATATAAAVSEAETANEKVQKLTEAAERIGQVVRLISDIAAQTNLLSLNATVEAARAGEAGKGFAVVANQVKALATQTARATEDIARQIASVQAESRDAAAAIGSITTTVQKINAIASGIAAAVEEQAAATREIARNVEQAAQATHAVSETIDGVSQAAAETGSAATQMLAAASELGRQSVRLHQEVDQFLEEVRKG